MPGSLPHILLGVLEHDRTGQPPTRSLFAEVVVPGHLKLDGMLVAIDEYLPVSGLLVVGILAVALRLLAPLVMWLHRDDACHSAYQHIPTSCVYEKIESTMATIGSSGIVRP